MKPSRGLEFPPEKKVLLKQAKRLEWITLIYVISATAIVGFVLGQSQAMKTAWMDDLLSLVPIIVFLVGSRISQWEPNERFPFGYHRVTSAAYLVSSVALTSVGLYLLVESAIKLFKAEHPTIGIIEVLGYDIWLGWLMIPALLYSMIPAMILSRKKLPIARELYEKVVFTDAHMNKADWMTEAAAIVGIIGIGLGYWWADATAAALIALDIVNDGAKHVRVSMLDLLDHRPQTIDAKGIDPVNERVRTAIHSLDWVEDAEIRLRVSGHILSGEAFVVPKTNTDLPERIESAIAHVRTLDWRLQDFSITPVITLDRTAP